MKKLLVIFLVTVSLFMVGCTNGGRTKSESTTVKKDECEHSFSVATCTTYSTCSKCGEQRGVLLNHQYVDEIIKSTCNVQGYTKHTCYYCGYSFNDTYTSTLSHSWGAWNIITQPSCSFTGIKNRSCTLCNKIQTVSVDKTEHTVTTKKGYAATCTSKGLTDGKYCSVCNATILKQQEIGILGHNYSSGKCTRCGKYDPSSYASTDTKLLFIEFINQSISNQGDAVDCMTKYIRYFDDNYITYFYQFVELGYEAAIEAYDISTSYIDMQTVSDDIKESCDILYSILNGSYTPTQLVTMIDTSTKHLSNAFYKIKAIMGY